VSFPFFLVICGPTDLFALSIIYQYFEVAAKEGDLAGMKGMIMG